MNPQAGETAIRCLTHVDLITKTWLELGWLLMRENSSKAWSGFKFEDDARGKSSSWNPSSLGTTSIFFLTLFVIEFVTDWVLRISNKNKTEKVPSCAAGERISAKRISVIFKDRGFESYGTKPFVLNQNSNSLLKMRVKASKFVHFSTIIVSL